MRMVKLLVVVTNALLFVLFLGLAATVDVREFKSKFSEKRGILTGLLCQFAIVPALGYLSTQLFELDATLGVTLLILCSSPGGSYSNWWCSLGNADLALSVAMTTSSTLLSMIMLPVNVLIYVRMAYGTDVPLDWVGLVASLIIAIAAIGSGLYCGAKKPEKRGTFNALGQVAGLCLIAISTIFSSRNDPIWNRDSSFYGACALPCIGALLISQLIASMLNLKKPETVAVVIETAYQNVGLATSIAVGTFDEEHASIALGVPVFYGLLEAVLIAVWCTSAHYLHWSYAPPGTPLLKAVVGNFQPGFAATVSDEGARQSPSGGTDIAILVQQDGLMLQPASGPGKTSSAASSGGESVASPREARPYSPPAMPAGGRGSLESTNSGSPARASSYATGSEPMASVPASGTADLGKYRTPSDPGLSPPTTPTHTPAGAEAARQLFVTVPPAEEAGRAPSDDVSPNTQMRRGAGDPSLGSPHHAPPQSPEGAAGAAEEARPLESAAGVLSNPPSSPRGA